MNFNNILNEIARVDSAFFEKTDQRRNILKNFTRKLALTAVPFALGSTFNKAYGQTSSDVLGVLNFVLSLEHIEAAFYTEAVTALEAGAFAGIGSGTPPHNALVTIRDQELAHVTTLTNLISAAGGTPLNAANYDFTFSGIKPTPLPTFTDYKIMLEIAQVLEDTVVRAYKGQIHNLISNNMYLTAAMNIHSVEARHASHIRQMRATMEGGNKDIKPWITGTESAAATDFKASYAGEATATQNGIAIIGIGGQSIDRDTATEAFDEPLTKDQVIKIVEPFIVP